LSEYARIAEAKGDVAEAIQRWKAVLYRFPLTMPVYSTVSQAFERLGEPAESEATLRTAVDRFPSELRPVLELAKLFHYTRRDFPAAAEAWAAMRTAFPDNEEAYISGADALRLAGRPEEADALREQHRLRFTSP
jgi:tetratricopeptide (TPR) repeat protein